MEGIVAKQWGKEEELKQLKSELAALDRKITAELKPSDAEEAARAKVVTPTKGNGEPLDEPAPSQSQDSKKSMVAEPTTIYKEREPLSSRIIIGGCGITPPEVSEQPDRNSKQKATGRKTCQRLVAITI